MGVVEFLRRLLGLVPPEGEAGDLAPARPQRGPGELARRLGMGIEELASIDGGYRRFQVPKRGGGSRRIAAPNGRLKWVQRRIRRRLLARLPLHPCATGFRAGCSIVTNAAVHAGRAVVLRMDIREFFASTTARRVRRYFRAIGWGADAAALLVRLTTLDGGLPQGAPTSPALSNLVNYGLDARLAGMALHLRRVQGGARTGSLRSSPPASEASIVYTRYADDLTFSFGSDDREAVAAVIRLTKRILGEHGYRLHHRRKLSIRRRHQSQRVCGLVVNRRVALPRGTRRWLRAVRHRIDTGREITLTPAQVAGWEALAYMIETQAPAP